VVKGEPLSDSEISDILARLPQLPALPGEQVEFKAPAGPLPPPRAGETVQQPFPPQESAAQPAGQPEARLEVLRYAPEGEISIAPFISVTFNQPMVPLATLADLASRDVPVQVEPALPGTWRWLGTKTLTFNYDSTLIDRLPKATAYTVRVPAGVKSASGAALDKSVEWTFTTPPVKLVSRYPEEIPQPAQPVIFMSFDQRIDPQAVLKTVALKAGGKAAALRLASDAEVKADKPISSLVKNTVEGRWMAVTPQEPLPLDSAVDVAVGPGTPSAEGPLLTIEAQSFSFHTYAALKIVESGCGWSGGSDCTPLTPFFIRFNNPLDEAAFTDGMLKIAPALPGVVANIYGDTIEIDGQSSGRTTYTVEVSGEMQDVFGQKLGSARKRTFKVGAAEPMLSGPRENFITLDPAAGKPVFSVYSINYSKLDVKVYAVKPADWEDYQHYLLEYNSTARQVSPPGRLAYDKAVPVEAKADTLVETAVDLKQLMDGDFGQFIVVVKPHYSLLQKADPWEVIHCWVQVTRIGLDAFVDQANMTAWATGLADGTPLEGVSITAGPGDTPAALTDAKGMARFALPDGAGMLVARKGADTAMLMRSYYGYGDEAWRKAPLVDELRWYVIDDRRMYRPGEEIHLKGWLRRVGAGPRGDVDLPGGVVSAVKYSIVEPQGNKVGEGVAKVGSLGGFDMVFTIPQGTNLGQASINFEAQGQGGLFNMQYTHTFEVQEFRRPEFEVSARAETPGPYFAGGSATVAVEAKYYAGGPLPNADVTWQVSSSPGSYSPPNWPDFTFGSWTPWWVMESDYGSFKGVGGGKTETFTGSTDASGTHYLKLDFNQDFGPRPVSIDAEASVMDVNRQAWAASTSLLVHPASLYAGMRSERYFVQKGTPLKIDLIVTDLDGKPVEDRPVEAMAARLEWKYRGGHWQEDEADVQKCSVGSRLEPVQCVFQTPLGGSYRITATVADSQGRKNQTQFTRWVSGGQRPPARKVEMEEVTLIPDRQTYQPGDTAEVLVQSPFSPAEGLLTVARSGILTNERFTITDGSITLRIPIEEQHIPNLNIQVDLVGSAPRVDDNGDPVSGVAPRPAYASGTMVLKVPPLARALKLEVKPDQAETEPGKETAVSVSVTGADGKPVEGAEVAVMAVDEAVLALSGYDLADPLSLFYAERQPGVDSTYSRASIILANPQQMLQDASVGAQAKGGPMPAAPMMAAAPMPTMQANMDRMAKEAPGGGNAPAPIAVRTDFNPLALFAPAVKTGADGTARVAFKLPDNLTRYRLMAVAVEGGKRFGSGEANLTARLPLMVRPSAPRFLNFGDQFELPVVVQNQTGSAMDVQVALRAGNMELTGARGLRVSVPAHNRVEVRFPAAAQMAGTARFQVAAVSGDYADAATIELPVYTPATSEAFAVYGTLDQGNAVQPLAAPSGVFPQYGGLEISTSSTALQSLTDAVLYLVSYPYECSEQLSSRILGVAALRDVLTAFKAEGMPSADEMEAAVRRDITRLQGMQNSDGGFPYWRRGQDSIPFNTIHTAHALARASAKGFEVPAEMKALVLEYLRQIETYYPSWYSQATRNHLTAYALYVRQQLGDSDPQRALSLLNEAGMDKIGLDALGWLWPVLEDYQPSSAKLDELRRYVNNRAVETAGAANFTDSYDDQSYLLLGSDRRTDAILLDALIKDNPQSDLVPKVVAGLMAHRTRGRWGSTQENVFVLLALDRYFNTFESQTPDFAARFWLGDAYAGEHIYRGRTTERQQTTIPMNYLIDQATSNPNLVISKDGAGRLYYRLGLRYAPTDLQLKALDMGFVLQRTYDWVDNPADVSRSADGTWHIKAGAKVRVKLNMVADNRRYHVALTDPLPAGLEIVNPALAVSGSTPQDTASPNFRYGWWWWGTWYEHQNMRDDRAEAFTSLLWDGVYDYSYIARATTPGTFIVPPTRAEEMYSPEVFGRSSSDVVVVE
jgi:uncharacterized protein YfaS (alpha-2-macroglobulin family)